MHRKMGKYFLGLTICLLLGYNVYGQSLSFKTYMNPVIPGDHPDEVENSIDSIVWLKLIRDEHMISGFYSSDGDTWIQIGESINAAAMDIEQTQFNNFTGNRKGLYVKGKPAFFDLYIDCDAYTNITAQNPANKFGVTSSSSYLGSINNDDWAMYAGVEFGGNDYHKTPVSMELSASSAALGGVVEVWIDSIDSGRKIAECQVDSTGSWTNYQIFSADVDSARLPDGQISGSHDVYLRFLGTGTGDLFRINWFRFLGEYYIPASADNPSGDRGVINKFQLNQNYPNPFNPITQIAYSVPWRSYIRLKVYNLLGQEVASLFEGFQQSGNYTATIDGSDFASGVYLYRMTASQIEGGQAQNFVDTKKTLLLK